MRESWPDHERSFRECWLLAILIAALSIGAWGQSPTQPVSGNSNLDEILAYIHAGWDSLTRSTNSCAWISDPKLAATSVLYLPADLPEPHEIEQMQRVCKLTVARLPQVIRQLGTTDAGSLQPPGLLYLKNKYVVPGGRFNEMYGWEW